jgi:antitoxin StbD
MHSEEYLSATDLSKKTAATIDALEKGLADKLIILRNNAPKAVLLSMDAYEELMEEIEDLRLGALALARAKTFSEEKALSHEQVSGKFLK